MWILHGARGWRTHTLLQLSGGAGNGKKVLTIEGLTASGESNSRSSSIDDLHPLQRAFVEYGAIQCGFCIPGQIMTAYALLQRNPDPTRDDVRQALKDTLCRCAGYPAIENAILAAAESLRTGEPLRAANDRGFRARRSHHRTDRMSGRMRWKRQMERPSTPMI